MYPLEILLAMEARGLTILMVGIVGVAKNGINCPSSCHTTHFYKPIELHL